MQQRSQKEGCCLESSTAADTNFEYKKPEKTRGAQRVFNALSTCSSYIFTFIIFSLDSIHKVLLIINV